MATNKQYFSELIAKTFSKKNLIFVGIVFSVLFLSGCNGAGGTPGVDAGKDLGIQITHGLMQIIGALLGVVTALVTILTHPGWYNGEFFGMQGYFKDIWILVSNVVYFAFAFILIRLAFMNIIGKGEGDFELKQALPRFVIGILIVPFSWFFVQFILSLSSILMVALMSLPADIFKDKALFTGADTDNICKEFSINLGSPISKAVNGGDSNGGKWFDCKGPKTSIKKIFDSEKGVYSLIGTYTYGILKLDQLNHLNAELSGKTVKTVTDLTIKTIFDLLFIIVYFVLMMALFIALLVRGVQIWLYIMFSPIFGLQYFFKKEEAGELDSFNFMEFVKVAFVPALVGAALSFGLVFIMVVNQGMMKPAPSSTSNMVKCEDNNKKCSIEVGEFKFIVEGAVGAGVGFVQEGAQIGLGALGAIMMNLFGLAVLWMAVMTALTSGGKMVNQVIEPIHSFGKEMGKLAMTSPQYLPILPGGLSAKSLPSVGSGITQSVESSSHKRSQDFLKAAGFDAGHTEKLHQIERKVKEVQLGQLRTNQFGNEIINSANLGSTQALLSSGKFQDLIKAMADKATTKVDLSGLTLSNEQDLIKALNLLAQKNPEIASVIGRDIQPAQLKEMAEGRFRAGDNPTTTSRQTGPANITVKEEGANLEVNIGNETVKVTTAGISTDTIVAPLISKKSQFTEADWTTMIQNIYDKLPSAQKAIFTDRDKFINEIRGKLVAGPGLFKQP